MENNMKELNNVFSSAKSFKIDKSYSELDYEKIFKCIADKFTPEYLEELGKKSYEDDRNYPENFSNWYPHIIDFGKFKHADIIANQIFTYEETEVMRQSDNIENVDWDKINNILKPTLDKLDDYKFYNIKNGCFSNKFDFSSCITTKKDLAKKLWQINYESNMLDTGGYTELVVREVIPHTNPFDHYTIYNGMPLREELRVFYNMNTKQIEYIVDYWDYDYCQNYLANKSDKLVFDYFHDKLINKNEKKSNHDKNIVLLKDLVYEYISSLKFDDYLTDIWSIDFLAEYNKDNQYDLYLIDMARGYRSAYWDKNKLTLSTQSKLKEQIL